jgi:hypothetical protein
MPDIQEDSGFVLLDLRAYAIIPVHAADEEREH